MSEWKAGNWGKQGCPCSAQGMIAQWQGKNPVDRIQTLIFLFFDVSLFFPLLFYLFCDPIPGILQARTLEWVAISFSNAEKWKVKVKSLSLVRLFATPWTAAYQAPTSMGFSRQEYWSGVPLPSPFICSSDALFKMALRTAKGRN